MMKAKGMKAVTLAGMLAAGMSMGTNVWASVPTVGTGTEAEPAKVSITKNLEIADGITVPKTEFTFAFTKVTEDAPDIAVKTVSYFDTDKAADHVVTKSTENIFEGVEFPHAGEFLYKLKETAGTIDVQSGKMTYDTSEYTVHVYVKNSAEGIYISDVTAEKNGKKQSSIDFLNTFQKSTSLTVSKKTAGDLADKTKKFSFAITFTKAPTCSEDSFLSNGETYKYGEEYTFELADSDDITFEIPAGTTYEVVEKAAADGYSPKVVVVENGGTPKMTEAQDADSLSSAAVNDGEKNLAGEGVNTVEFTNTHHASPVTGVNVSILPFIAMMLASAAGLAGCVFGRRHRMAR